MKGPGKYILPITLGFLLAACLLSVLIGKHYEERDGMRIVLINRMLYDAQEQLAAGIRPQDMDLQEQLGEFEEGAMPDKICFLAANDASSEEGQERLQGSIDGSEIACPFRAADGELLGFFLFSYDNANRQYTLCMVGIVLLAAYFALMLGLYLVYRRMIKPLQELSGYPEKIAKGYLKEGLPNAGKGLLGKYIWGMNMLRDEMKRKDKNLNLLEKEKQTLIVSVAHGIKTPLSNIRLYAEAIERGIYREDKTPDPKDAEVAGRINKNVDKVELLVKEIMKNSSEANTAYTPVISSFYLKEIAEAVRKEYSGRMELLHIPFEIVCENDPLLTSDADGICKVIAQLLDNAVKYGDGRFIRLQMGRQDEDIIISVKNSGTPLSEEETAYVFKSFWRGSNARSQEGQGIGLYVARKTAESLGGDIFMKSLPQEEVTEVTMIVPL